MFTCITLHKIFDCGLVQNVIGGIAVVYIVKLFYYAFIFRFLGTYYHADAKTANKKFFTVRSNPLFLLSPIPNMRLTIELKNNGITEWKGVYYSDMLSMFYFRGLYHIPNPENGQDGWHDIHFVKHKEGGITKRRIAVNIHFLDESKKSWNNDGGYYIEKIS